MSVQVFDSMIGAEITNIQQINGKEMIFHSKDGNSFRFYHWQDCCESVWIEDIVGDLDDLLNTPLVVAEEVSNADAPKLAESYESYTWTFYRFGTAKGTVTVRWLGVSNGYYSEAVSFEMN